MRNYRPILLHFENHASDPNDREASAMKGRAKLVQHTLKQYNMLLFIHLMLDVLQELKHLLRPYVADGLGWTADDIPGSRGHAGENFF